MSQQMPESKLPEPSGSTAKWAFLGAFVGLAGVIFGVGLLILGHLRAEFRRGVETQLMAIADLKVSQIVDWRQERLADGRAIMQDPFVAEHVQRFLAGASSSETQAPLASWLESVRLQNQSGRAMLLDRELNVRQASPAGQTNLGPVARAFASEAMHSNQVVISDLHRGQVTGQIHFDLSVPLYTFSALNGAGAVRSEAQLAGVLDLEIEPHRLLYPLIQSWPTPSLTAETLLVRREGDEVLYLNELRHRKGTALALRVPLAETNRPAALVVLGHEGTVAGLDYRGEPVLTAMRPVPGTPWYLVAKIDQQEAFAPFRTDTRLLLISTFSIICLMGLVAGVLWRQREARFLREELLVRKEAEDRIRKLTRAIDQSPTSIMITDARGAIEYVNPKFCVLTGYSFEEVRGQSARLLKSGQMPPETYRELWTTILGGGEWRGEFRNKKKNGELYWEFASISAVKDDAGRITHFVAVKEDIGERKKADAERELLIKSLEEALVNIKTLSGLLPICASCKKIRDDKGFWSQVETYVTAHSAATFTHGLCPECIRKHYPDLADDMTPPPQQ